MLKFIHTYALVIPLYLALLTTLARLVYGIVARLVAPYPRARAAVEALAAMSPDVLRAFVQLYRVTTGRDFAMPLVDARDAEIARLRDVIAAQAARLQALGAADTRAQDPLSRRATPVPPVALGLVVLLGVLGCASGPRSTDATVSAILSGTRLAQAAACSRGADTFLGPLQEPSTQLPATRTPATLTTFIRAWVCAPLLTYALDTVDAVQREVARAIERGASTPSPSATTSPSTSSTAPTATARPNLSPTPPAPTEDTGPVPAADTDAAPETP